ncbi:unnamed protein product [Ectocarpus sp. 13 AM-2016]
MGAGASVAEELASPRHNQSRPVAGSISATGCQYREMLDHLRNRFMEELEVLRAKYGEVDQDGLIVKLLMEEFSFTTVEATDLQTLKTRSRDKGKVYLLGETNFMESPLSERVNYSNLKPKALEMVGDEKLNTEAREALPANTRTSKKAVELMGSTKVVTEKKALKRLGSEMSDSMRVLQIKTERKEQKEEENRRNLLGAGEAGGGGGGDKAVGADGGRAADGVTPLTLSPTKSMAAMRVSSPGSFVSSPMARRATRLLTEVPKFITDMGGGSSKKEL